MFDLSFGELLVIAIVGLIIIGPKDLPVVARYLRNIFRSIRETTASIRQQMDEALDVEELRDATRMIEGDDGTLYESFDLEDTLSYDTRRTQREPHDPPR